MNEEAYRGCEDWAGRGRRAAKAFGKNVLRVVRIILDLAVRKTREHPAAVVYGMLGLIIGSPFGFAMHLAIAGGIYGYCKTGKTNVVDAEIVGEDG